MDRGDFLIEKVAEQFLVEVKNENRDVSYTAGYYIPTRKDVPADLLSRFDQSEQK